MYKILLLLFSISLFGVEEFNVFLERVEEKKPLYLYEIEKINSSISQEYLSQLKKVMRFDLEHLDRIFLLKDNPIEAQAAFYEVRPKISKDLMLFEFYANGKKFEFPPFTLTQDLNLDRRNIHQVLDSFYLKLFHKKSILTTKLIYSVRREISTDYWASDIYVSDYDGKNPEAKIRDRHYHLCPCFLPNEDNFLYVSYKTGWAKIYSNESELPYITLAGNQILPSISKDGKKIAFISDAAGRPDLFLQIENQKPIQLFSYPRATQASPVFDPKAKRIAFVSDKDGPPRIYVLDIPKKFGKRPIATLITKKNRENTCPNWSCDGTKIAYSAKTEGIRQIWIYDFETKEEWQLTFGGKNKENPSWAIDNCHLVYNTEDDSELFLINIENKKETKITRGQGEKRFASWQTN